MFDCPSYEIQQRQLLVDATGVDCMPDHSSEPFDYASDGTARVDDAEVVADDALSVYQTPHRQMMACEMSAKRKKKRQIN